MGGPGLFGSRAFGGHVPSSVFRTRPERPGGGILGRGSGVWDWVAPGFSGPGPLGGRVIYQKAAAPSTSDAHTYKRDKCRGGPVQRVRSGPLVGRIPVACAVFGKEHRGAHREWKGRPDHPVHIRSVAYGTKRHTRKQRRRHGRRHELIGLLESSYISYKPGNRFSRTATKLVMNANP